MFGRRWIEISRIMQVNIEAKSPLFEGEKERMNFFTVPIIVNYSVN